MRVERIVWGDPGFERAKAFEYEIFGRMNGYIGPRDVAAAEMVAYREFERSSEFHVAWDPDTRSEVPAGLVRFIRHDPAKGFDSFITVRDARGRGPAHLRGQRYIFDACERFLLVRPPATIAELATQAIQPQYRSMGVILWLWHSIGVVSLREGIEIWTMALATGLFDVYRRQFPSAVQPIGSVIPAYIGCDSIP
jgi:hypothetical protein